MSYFVIDDIESYKEYKQYLMDESPDKILVRDNIIETEHYTVEVGSRYNELLNFARKQNTVYGNDLIYGKDKTENIVAIEIVDDNLHLFKNDGTVEIRPNTFWLLSNRKLDKGFVSLEGRNHYKYIRTFGSSEEYYKMRSVYQKKRKDIWCVWNDVEAAMIYQGITLFKGLKVEDVSVLSFDIESSGLVRDDGSKVFVITNTFKNKNNIIRKQYREDKFLSIRNMIETWCDDVVDLDPDVMNGHNIFGFDLDYLNFVALKNGTTLRLGRDGSDAKFKKRPNKYRVDGSQVWEYKNCNIFGRQIIDGMFLATKYDIGRNYSSWGLKPISEYEGLVDEDRQFYDASKIGENWHDPVEREKIVKYCSGDSDDSLGLYELMIPSFFYLAQNIPKPFQMIVNSASGAWLNTILVRGYLQQGHSIPKTREQEYVAGGISFGNPAVHKNVFKIDIKSMYPSIMRQWKVHDKTKDPQALFYNIVDHFTIQRFEQKAKHKETGDKHYDDLQASSKIFINSAYGMMGTPGLNFNSFANADFVTGVGRQIIRKTIRWATSEGIKFWWEDYESEKDDKYDEIIDKEIDIDTRDYIIVNADTDSISFRKKDSSEFSKEDMDDIINEVNGIFPEMIEYEDDGYFEKIVVVKAKNYVLKEFGKDKLKYKGSSLSDPKKEPALLEMLKRIIEEVFIKEETDYRSVYDEYLAEAYNIGDINRWAIKKSITEKLLEGNDTIKKKVLKALEGTEFQIGDKVFLFQDVDGERQKVVKGELEYYTDGRPKMKANDIYRKVTNFSGTYDKWHYIKRVYSTVETLVNLIDLKSIPKYHNKTQRTKLEELLN